MAPIPHDVPKTKGAVLIGGLAATLLTGFVYVQTALYFKVYTSDMWQIKAIVAVVWLLDTVHIVFIWLALWSYFILNFGREQGVDALNWEIGVIIIFTGLVTYLVHIFHLHRIFRLAKRKYLATLPIFFLATVRMVFAIVSGAEMLRFETISRYRRDVGWIFTSGLTLSAAVDVLITISLIVILCLNRRGTPTLDAIVGVLMKYAFETACVTCAGSLSTVFCWALMPHNLIFLGLYFVVGKLYANSLLSTLNVRRYVRRTSLKGFPDTAVERMQFRPGRAGGETSHSSEDTEVQDQRQEPLDGSIVDEIARASSTDDYHATDMSYVDGGGCCLLPNFRPPCLKPPGCAYLRPKTVVQVKVEKKVESDHGHDDGG